MNTYETLQRLVAVLEQKGLLNDRDANFILSGQEPVLVTNTNDDKLDRILEALGLDVEPEPDVLDKLFEEALADGNKAACAIREEVVMAKYDSDGERIDTNDGLPVITIII